MSNLVTLLKINESFSMIQCEDSIRYELSDYFTFDVESAIWSPAYKNGWWDGKIRLLKSDMTIYTGLRDEIERFCKERNYEFDCDYGTDVDIDPDKLMNHIMSWNPTRYDGNDRIPLKPHQEQMAPIYASLVKRRLIIESATAAGKSFIVCALSRILYKKKILIIGSKVDLVNQLLENYHEYFEHWDPQIDILYSGQKITGANILIATWQSLYKKQAKFFERFGVVIYDEVHEAESKSACKILESCINAKYKIGTTGTLKDAKTHQLTLTGLFGKSYKFSKAKDNIDQGKSAPLDILIKKISYSKKLEGKFDSGAEKYRAELEYIWYNKERNNHIYETVTKLNGTTLVLFKNVEHGVLLHKEYTEKYGDEDVFIIYGGIDKDVRKEIRQYAVANPNKKIVIFASIGTFSTGINIPNIKSIILAGPIKDKIKLLQSIGRGLRLKSDGGRFLFIDIVDIIVKGGILNKHGKERINRYIQEEFNYKVEQIKL